MTLFQGTGAKKGRQLGTKRLIGGHSCTLCDSRCSPIPQTPRTPGSHLRSPLSAGTQPGLTQNPERAFPGNPPAFRSFPSHGEPPVQFWETSWMKPRQGPDSSRHRFLRCFLWGLSSQQPGLGAWRGGRTASPSQEQLPRCSEEAPGPCVWGLHSCSHIQGIQALGSTLPPQPIPSGHLAPGHLSGNQVSGPLLKGPPLPSLCFAGPERPSTLPTSFLWAPFLPPSLQGYEPTIGDTMHSSGKEPGVARWASSLGV